MNNKIVAANNLLFCCRNANNLLFVVDTYPDTYPEQ